MFSSRGRLMRWASFLAIIWSFGKRETHNVLRIILHLKSRCWIKVEYLVAFSVLFLPQSGSFSIAVIM